MAQYDAFDGQEASYQNKPDKEIWELGDLYDKKTWNDLAKWVMGMKSYLREENRERLRRIEQNLAIYKGIQYQSQSIREDSRDYGSDRSRAVNKVVANHVYDLIQNKVSRLIKYRPGIAALPTSNEVEDRVGAKMSENLIRHIWYVQNFEGEVQNEFVKQMFLAGEAYLAVLWDPQAGEMAEGMQDYLKELNEKGEVTLTDDQGNPEVDEEGKPIKISRVVKIGDVIYALWFSQDCLVDRSSTSYANAQHFWHRELISKALAKRKYGYDDKFQGNDGDNQYYDYEKLVVKGIANQVALWKIFVKKSEFLPQGADITFIGNKIVECTPAKSTSGDFPVCRLTDIDLMGEIHGESFITIIKSLTGTYNNLTNMIVRNQVLASHPKWVFPAGSVKKESLGNDITMVEFKGPVAPILAQQNPTPGEVFSFRDSLKQEFQQVSGIFGVSRGEPPPGIKAGVALQFLAEQENERSNESVLKYNEWIRQVAIKTVERCADNYQPDDKRMIMVLGFANKWMTSFFDVKYLSRRYDIRIQNSSALPQSKAARTQYLMDLNESFPEQVPPEMVLDMLDISQPDKFIDYVTATVRAAEAENETIMRGIGKIVDPEIYEDHVTMWKIHVKQMREWSFKNQTPDDIKQQLADHVAAHEMLMLERTRIDQTYLQQCMALPGWPIYFPLEQAMPAPLPPPPMEGAMPPEGAPVNEPLPGAEDMPVNVPPPAASLQMDAENALPASEGPLEPTTAI